MNPARPTQQEIPFKFVRKMLLVIARFQRTETVNYPTQSSREYAQNSAHAGQQENRRDGLLNRTRNRYYVVCSFQR